MWLLSESVSNFCLCFQTGVSAANQYVQSASVCVNSQVTVQSSRCKLSVDKKCKQLCVHILNIHKNSALRHNIYFNIAAKCSMTLGTTMLPSESMRSAAVIQAFVPVACL